MNNINPPLGPGHNNVKNIDGSTLSYFQRSDFPVTAEAISTVFYALQNSAAVHETDLTSFTRKLNECSFFVQGYDNDHFACFGAIKILSTEDLNVLNQYYGGFGVDPYGYSAYGGGFSYKGIFGELRYVYQDPAYANDQLGNKVVDLLLQSQADFVNPANSRTVLCVIPGTIPSGSQYDYLRYLQTGPSGATTGTQGVANTSSIPYHNVTASSSLLATYFK